MLTILQQPGEISLSRNQMLLSFRALDGSGQPYGQQGIRSELRNIGLDGILAEEQLTINWVEPNGSINELTFTAKTNPVAEDEISASVSDVFFGYSQVYGYFITIANQIQSHHQIQPHFKVYAQLGTNQASIWLETRELTNGWSASWDISGISDNNYSVIDYSEVLTTNAPTDYKILLDIVFETTYLGGDFELIASLDLYLNSASEAVVDLSSILDPALQETLPELMLPAFDADAPLKADILRRFYFRYRESYEGADTNWINSSIRSVLCGGISQALFAGGEFFASLNSLNSLLSWYPLSKTVSANQPEWIAWFNYTGGDKQVTLQIQEYGADSSVPNTRTLVVDPVLVVAADEVALLPAGPAQLEIADTTLKYVIRVVNQLNNTELLSQKRSYYLDRPSYRSLRFIQYLNSFCLPETLRCVGVFEKELEVDRKERQLVLAEGYSSYAPELRQYDQDFENRFTYRSGYLSKVEVEALQELLIYNKVYEVSEAGAIPLHLIDQKFRVLNTGEILSSIQFKAMRSQRLLNYSLDQQLLQPGTPEVIIVGCNIVIAGTYNYESQAISAGLIADQYFAIGNLGAADLGVAPGAIFRVQPTYEFPDFEAAFAGGVANNSCFALSQQNIFGMPRHLVIMRNPIVTYKDDAAATTGGVLLNEVYPLAQDNPWSMPKGTMKKRF